jgi:hypothetical protein
MVRTIIIVMSRLMPLNCRRIRQREKAERDGYHDACKKNSVRRGLFGDLD